MRLAKFLQNAIKWSFKYINKDDINDSNKKRDDKWESLA